MNKEKLLKYVPLGLALIVVSPFIPIMLATIIALFPFIVGGSLSFLFSKMFDKSDNLTLMVLYIFALCCSFIGGIALNVFIGEQLIDIAMSIVSWEYGIVRYFTAK